MLMVTERVEKMPLFLGKRGHAKFNKMTPFLAKMRTRMGITLPI